LYSKSVYSDGGQMVKQRHILTWVKLNIASIFHIFHQLQAKFSTGHVHNNVPGDCKLCGNQHSKSHTFYFGASMDFCLFYPQLISDLGDTQCKKPEINAFEHLRVFFKYSHKEGHIFFCPGINEITFMHVP